MMGHIIIGIQMNDNIDMCSDCPQRSTCKELCAVAEEYANQDVVDHPTPGAIPSPVDEYSSDMFKGDIWEAIRSTIVEGYYTKGRGGRAKLGTKEWNVFSDYLERQGLSIAETLIFYKIFWKGETHRQVAEHFNVSRQAINQRVKKIKKKLKK